MAEQTSAEVEYRVDDYFTDEKLLDAVGFIFDGTLTSKDKTLDELRNVFSINMLAAFYTASTLPVFARRTAYNTGYMTMFGITLTASLIGGLSEDRIKEAKESLRKSIEETEWGEKLKEMSKMVATGYLSNFIQEDGGRKATGQIMNQCVVLTWSSFEILASDVFGYLLNMRPNLAAVLFKDETTKKHYREKDLASSLEEYKYDLSRHMGDALLSQYRFDNLFAIKNVYGALCKEPEALRKILGRAELWRLYKIRNLIVHRAGVVDSTFQKDTGEKMALGTSFRVLPSELRAFMILIGRVAQELISFAESVL